MIRSLRIRNLATIEDLEISFADGFSILTGETGAGKSIIIDGIKLALGDKASPELIRTGKTEAVIEAVFTLPERRPENGEPDLEGDVLIQRSIPLEGSGRTYLNGVLVPVKKIRDLGPSLVDIYGQNDHIFLLQVENHLLYLDDFLGLAERRQAVTALARDLRQLDREIRSLAAQKREREQRIDFLDYQIRELENAGLRPGEWEELQAERSILKNAEKIARLVDQALELSYLEDHSILASLARLQESLRDLCGYDPSFEPFKEALGQTSITVRELADSLIRYKERQSLGPERLEEIEGRLAHLERLRKKYGETIEGMISFLGRAREQRIELEHSEERLAEFEAKATRLLDEYRRQAAELSRLRREGGPKLEAALEKEIACLDMPRARFKVRIDTRTIESLTRDEVADSGADEVEFCISPNPGEELRPLRRIASGGELSRIMLALKTLGREREKKTLIFDEIDSGIGGKTAESIAQKLRDLATRHQVICITHLPQIASFARHHYRIEKSVVGDRTFTTVKRLDFEERVTEISRLLSGHRLTPASLQNARDMLQRNLKTENSAPPRTSRHRS